MRRASEGESKRASERDSKNGRASEQARARKARQRRQGGRGGGWRARERRQGRDVAVVVEVDVVEVGVQVLFLVVFLQIGVVVVS